MAKGAQRGHIWSISGTNLLLCTFDEVLPLQISSSICSGFELATRAGPICEEPLRGVAFVVESVRIVNAETRDVQFVAGGVRADSGVQLPSDAHAALIGSMKSALRRAFTASVFPRRLCEPVLTCALQAAVDSHSGDVLGRLYGVLSSRRARVLNETIIEGTSIFCIDAALPAAEAFGLADELRKKTSGAASTPQLRFSHWKVFESDPFEKGQKAYEYVLESRKRQGLATMEKLVVRADAQRTRARKK